VAVVRGRAVTLLSGCFADLVRIVGLAIVHRLVTSNGGTAKLTETAGGGLTAILEFPGVPAPNNPGAEYPSSAQNLASL